MSGGSEFWDVAVVGGGPAGATAARCLARAGASTVLIDETPDTGAVGEGLPPGAKPLFRDLGLWDAMDRDGHLRSCGNESAWGTPHLRSTHFVADPNGNGWHLDRRRLDVRLQTAARDAGVRVHAGTRARQVVRTGDGWDVTIGTGPSSQALRARWVIDATGRRAWLGRRGGATRAITDRLVAFVARCPHRGQQAPHPDAVTLVESARDGWWYTSRLPSGDRVVAYLTDADDTSARQARTHEGFATLLDGTRHVSARVSQDHTVDAPPSIVAAGTSRLDQLSGEGWLAAGDAAISLDPLSSQGILNAVYSGMIAAHATVAHLGGDRAALAGYRQRLGGIFATYLSRRRDYYQQEQRWADRPFWQRRMAT